MNIFYQQPIPQAYVANIGDRYKCCLLSVFTVSCSLLSVLTVSSVDC